jgi:NAD-dependent deacetylase
MTKKPRLVVLSGAGISAESGLKTFRNADGLWENHSIEEVASIDGWRKNPNLVLDFYNQRRAQAFKAQPNAGHKALKELERYFDVKIITQNVDDLHEKAGSSWVLHLHGQLSQVRSEKDDNLIYDYKDQAIYLGDTAEDGYQLRPNIVWFGEVVPRIEEATEICYHADLFLVVGTSLNVYPAAGLIHAVPSDSPVYVVDPHLGQIGINSRRVKYIKEKAGVALPKLVDELILKIFD